MTQINTHFDHDKYEPVETYGGKVRDTIILLRDACHKMQLHGLREVYVIQAEKDCRIEVRARR